MAVIIYLCTCEGSELYHALFSVDKETKNAPHAGLAITGVSIIIYFDKDLQVAFHIYWLLLVSP